jgi:type VI secretion system VasD/TssJ family lipoprotein
MRARRLRRLLPTASLLAALLAACGGAPGPVSFCMDLQASTDLNFYNGQPHVVALYIYPLRSQADFQRLTVEELLSEGSAPGMDPPRQITVGPGQTLPFEDTLPPMTTSVGLVADYYYRPGDPEGTRKLVLAAECGRFGRQTVTLSARELTLQQ